VARGDQQAQGAAGQANANANTFMGNANSLYGNLAPSLESQAANPQGFAPSDQAAMATEAAQTAGGTEAGAVGAGNLAAARTRNAGGFGTAISDASRGAGETLSRGLLGVKLANANLKNQQRNTALSGLGSLYGENVGASNAALGNVAANVNANNGAIGQSWDWAKAILDPAGGVAAAKAGCWIAEAVYGVDDPRTHIARAWLNGPFRETAIGNAVMTVYVAMGRQVAWFVRRSALLRAAFKPLFDAALRKATE
jgi:hypothetical protein